MAAQAGIFSFFINYMTAEVPPIPESLNSSVTKLAESSPGFLKGWLSGWFKTTFLRAEDIKDCSVAYRQIEDRNRTRYRAF